MSNKEKLKESAWFVGRIAVAAAIGAVVSYHVTKLLNK